jgi:hypothetical protein
MSVRAVRRLVMEDLLRLRRCVHSPSSWFEPTLRPRRDSFSNWTLRLPNDETLPVREKPPRSYWSQFVGFREVICAEDEMAGESAGGGETRYPKEVQDFE